MKDFVIVYVKKVKIKKLNNIPAELDSELLTCVYA